MYSSINSTFIFLLILIINVNFMLADDDKHRKNPEPILPHLVNETIKTIKSFFGFVEELHVQIESDNLNSTISIPLLVPVGTISLFNNLINMFNDAFYSEQNKRYVSMTNDTIQSLNENIKRYFGFIRELDDEECLAKMICEIGANPFSYGPYGQEMNKFFINLNSSRINNDNVKFYLDEYNLGNKEGLESCELKLCNQNMSEIAKYFNNLQIDNSLAQPSETVKQEKKERSILSLGWKKLIKWIGFGPSDREKNSKVQPSSFLFYAYPKNFLNFADYSKSPLPLNAETSVEREDFHVESSNNIPVLDDETGYMSETLNNEKMAEPKTKPVAGFNFHNFVSKFGFPFRKT